MANTRAKNNNTAANLGFEAKLWQAADALRNNLDAAEYKHVVLGLIFLKYISDAFEAKHAELESQKAQGPSVRSVLRLGRHVREQREVHRSARRQARRHLHLRSGVELHYLASG